MSVESWISLFEALGIWAGSVFVVVQLRAGNIQQQLQALVQIHDVNRELLILGFSHPQLFAVLEDRPTSDPDLERHYLQLWLNQYYQIHLYFKDSVLKGEIKDGLFLGLSDFLSHRNTQKHWETEGVFYPASFRKLVGNIIEANKKLEPPSPATAALQSQEPKT